MKKKWVAPELTCLIRTLPEESILGGCKTASAGTTTPTTLNVGCYQNDGFNHCTDCSNISSS